MRCHQSYNINISERCVCNMPEITQCVEILIKISGLQCLVDVDVIIYVVGYFFYHKGAFDGSNVICSNDSKLLFSLLQVLNSSFPNCNYFTQEVSYTLLKSISVCVHLV